MSRIDVHMLVMGSEREDWMAKALASIPRDICNVHVTDGIKGDVGKARVKGYRLGTCEYVSFVDPDDWIEPGTFEKCLAYMEEKNARGVVTEEIVYDYFKDMKYRTRHKHGLSVYRREWIETKYPSFEKRLVSNDVQISLCKEIVQMTFVGRHWRKYPSECFKLRQAAGLHSKQPSSVVFRADWD